MEFCPKGKKLRKEKKKMLFKKKDILKAAKYSNLSQKIQMMVWNYMDTPNGKRDGTKMAEEIISLCEKYFKKNEKN